MKKQTKAKDKEDRENKEVLFSLVRSFMSIPLILSLIAVILLSYYSVALLFLFGNLALLTFFIPIYFFLFIVFLRAHIRNKRIKA